MWFRKQDRQSCGVAWLMHSIAARTSGLRTDRTCDKVEGTSVVALLCWIQRAGKRHDLLCLRNGAALT
jgi:hypothetical protein